MRSTKIELAPARDAAVRTTSQKGRSRTKLDGMTETERRSRLRRSRPAIDAGANLTTRAKALSGWKAKAVTNALSAFCSRKARATCWAKTAVPGNETIVRM